MKQEEEQSMHMADGLKSRRKRVKMQQGWISISR
jgi:hypothetical protein